MQKSRIRKKAQTFTCVIYCAIITLYVIVRFMMLGYKNIAAYFIAAAYVVATISIVDATKRKNVTDKTHGIIIIIGALLIETVTSIIANQYLYIHVGLLIVTMVICIYENLWLNQFMLFASLVVYLLTAVVRGTYTNEDAKVVVMYLLTGLAVIAAECIVAITIKKVERYQKVISENNQSSRDMLRVVEIKRQEAENAVKAKSMFLSNMSHEIRTPINAILGIDEIIRRESNETNVIEYAGKIKVAGNTLLSLVNDILDFSKIESGKMVFDIIEYDFGDFLNEIYNMISLRAEEKGLKLHFDISPDIPIKLLGDPLRVKQCYFNVLNNAVKYTEKGKITMRVTTEKVTDKRVRIFTEVVDTGIGIRKDDIDKIFDSFQRVDTEYTRNIEGTGLGMTITKNLLIDMDGGIRVESEYGVGSTFYMEYEQDIADDKVLGKYVPDKPLHSENVKYKESFTAPDAHILVVDDNEMNLMVVKGLLKKTLVNIDVASSGRQCIEMVKKNKYDLIFMDHMMPEMDGIETLYRLKELNPYEEWTIPIIALTANAISGSREMYLSKGFSEYLSKPIKNEEIEKMLIRFLPENLVNRNLDVRLEGDKEISSAKLDSATALKYVSNDKTLYFETLQVFLKSSDETRKNLAGFMENGDWDNYTVKVHALKSNAKYIGAIGLSELAFDHEKAGKAYNGEFIRENWDSLVAEWDEVLDAVRGILSDELHKDTRARK